MLSLTLASDARGDTARYWRGRERVLGRAEEHERLDRIEATLRLVVDLLERLLEGRERDREEDRLRARADPEATALLMAKYPDVYGPQEPEACDDREADQ